MALDDKDLEVTIQIRSNRTFDVTTGKSIQEQKLYEVRDVYTNKQLKDLLVRITPADSTIPTTTTP